MAVVKKGGKWYIVISSGRPGPDGRYKQDWVPTVNATNKTEAKAEEAEEKKRRLKGFTTSTTMKVSELFGLWKTQHIQAAMKPLEESTQTWYCSHWFIYIYPIIGDRKIRDLKILDLEQVLNQCAQKGCIDTTLRAVYATMSAMFSWAKKKRIIEENLMEFIDRPTVAKRIYTLLKEEDIDNFLEVIKIPEKFERHYATFLRGTYYAMFLVELTTGLRINELCGLKETNINWQEKSITIEKQVKKAGANPKFGAPKNKKMRTIPLIEPALKEIKDELIRKEKKKEEAKKKGLNWTEYNLIFTNQTGGPINSKNLNTRVFKSFLKRANLSEMKFHELRHTVFTLLGDNNVDLNAIAEMAGHADVQFCKSQYIHNSLKVQRQAADMLEKIFSARKTKDKTPYKAGQ